MTGKELKEYLDTLPTETLEQEILFEVLAKVSPTQEIGGPVRALYAITAEAEYKLTPNGVMTCDLAMENYKECKEAVKLGEMSEEEIEPYMPFHCPTLIYKDQMIIKLQTITGYPSQETDQGIPLMKVC